MRVPVWIKPAVWGAIFGAIGVMIVGFSWLGWTLDHTAKRLVAEGKESAVVAALTPFCVANYLKQPGATEKLAALRADSSSYTQRDIIEKAGFATMPGQTEPSAGLAAACAIALQTVSVPGPERKGSSGAAEANTGTK